MWEDATPKPAQQSAEPENRRDTRAKGDKSADNLVLWAQILLTALALGGLFAAQKVQLPLCQPVTAVLRQALAEPGLSAFEGERQLIRFVQEVSTGLQQQAARAADLLTGSPSTGETASQPAGTAHGKAAPSPPSGCSTRVYLPDFSVIRPLESFTLSSRYGWRSDPLTEEETPEFHKGMDLAAAEGTPVLAAAGGTVRSAVQSQSYGNCLRLLHEGGDETLYAHMQYIFVHPGQRVRQGEVIGTVGQTGQVTGPHLHFELMHQGIRCDPTGALDLA